MARGLAVRMSVPSKSIRSALRRMVLPNRPISASEVSDLPDPLSPTIHSVSPRIRSKSIPRTACNVPPPTGISSVRLRTLSRGFSMVSAPVFGGGDVAQTVAHQVDRQHEDEQHGTGKDRKSTRL